MYSLQTVCFALIFFFFTNVNVLVTIPNVRGATLKLQTVFAMLGTFTFSTYQTHVCS